VTNEDPAGDYDADLIVVLGDSHEPPPNPLDEEPPTPSVPAARPAPASHPYPPPEDTAPEWWVAMSFEADDEDPERVGRLPETPEPPPAPAAAEAGPPRRTYGMLALAAFLAVLVFAGLVTRIVG